MKKAAYTVYTMGICCFMVDIPLDENGNLDGIQIERSSTVVRNIWIMPRE